MYRGRGSGADNKRFSTIVRFYQRSIKEIKGLSIRLEAENGLSLIRGKKRRTRFTWSIIPTAEGWIDSGRCLRGISALNSSHYWSRAPGLERRTYPPLPGSNFFGRFRGRLWGWQFLRVTEEWWKSSYTSRERTRRIYTRNKSDRPRGRSDSSQRWSARNSFSSQQARVATIGA